MRNFRKAVPTLAASLVLGQLAIADSKDESRDAPRPDAVVNQAIDDGQDAAAEARQRALDAAERASQNRERGANEPIERESLKPVAADHAALTHELQGFIANCLVLANHEQVTLSQRAQEHSQNPQVKQFAQKLINDHQALNQKLQQFATADHIDVTNATTAHGRTVGTADRNRAAPSTRGTTAADARSNAPDADARNNRTDQNIPRQSNADRSNANSDPSQAGRRATADSAVDATRHGSEGQHVSAGDSRLAQELFALQQDAARQCVALIQQDLAQRQGEEFDQAYLGYEVGMHIGMLAKLKAAESHVSGEFQQVLQQAQQSVMQHKQQAEELMETISRRPATSGSR
ncbi:MAG: DUF4142 domain-containing protein [Planctomycetaceae bacterium]|nr:DUF4142 domain-containing protein [Planctomycetaceae bacterium]